MKNLLGQPSVGVHKHFLFNFAELDTIFTFVASYLISKKFNYKLISTFFVLFLTGQLFHLIFGVETAFIKLLKD